MVTTSGGAFFIPGRGDRIFINPFLLKTEVPSDIVSNLECNKKTEYGMRTFFIINAPQKQDINLDPRDPNVLFLSTSEKKATSI